MQYFAASKTRIAEPASLLAKKSPRDKNYLAVASTRKN